jgi:hypothetical protein
VVTKILDEALNYAARGWPVFPCSPDDSNGRAKRPLLGRQRDHLGNPIPKTGGLYQATTDAGVIEGWWRNWPRALIGVPMGRATGVFAIDPDVPKKPRDPDGLLAWRALLDEHGGLSATHTHLTPSGGLHLLFRWNEGRPITNSEGQLPAGINVRGEGGYIIAPPSQLIDGRAYRMENESQFFHFAEAPEWLYELILSTPQKRPASQGASPRSHGSSYVDAAIQNECAAVAAAKPGHRNNTLNTAAFKLGTLVGMEGLSEAECTQALLSAAAACGLIGDDGLEAVRATIDSGLVAGTKNPRQRSERIYGLGETHSFKRAGSDQPKRITATPFVWRDPTSIPRRQWLYGTHLIRKFGSATIAHPGVGKSALVLGEAIALATGRDLYGILPRGRCRTWYWNGEDPLEETERRIAAICLQFGIRKEDLEGQMFIDSGREQEIVLARQTRDGAKIAEPVVAALIDTIKANKIDVLTIDPFISSHRVTENDNNAIEVVVKEWMHIAEVTQCALELVHHSKKTGGIEVTVEDGRGAVALLAAVRSARVLNTMTKKEAAEAGVKAHRTYFRLENGKSNLAPPPEETHWYNIRSVSLGNGDATNALDPGDCVGVVVSWKWPNYLADVTGAVFEKAKLAIEAGRWRENIQAADWVGYAVARALEMDVGKPGDKAKIKAMLKLWMDAGNLRIVTGADTKGMQKKFIEVADHVDD